MTGILDCVTTASPFECTVGNAHVFHVGQKVRVRQAVDGPDMGTIEILKVREKQKALDYASIDGGIILLRVGDFLLVDDSPEPIGLSRQ